MARRLTSLNLSRGHYEVVEWGGRIASTSEPWEVSYTLSEDGWIDLNRRAAYGDLRAAYEGIIALCTDQLDRPAELEENKTK